LPLINCPECEERISDKADACPHCGLPARHFFTAIKAIEPVSPTESIEQDVDYSKIRNSIISFEHAYQTTFGANNYITSRDLNRLEQIFKYASTILSDKQIYEQCTSTAHGLS